MSNRTSNASPNAYGNFAATKPYPESGVQYAYPQVSGKFMFENPTHSASPVVVVPETTTPSVSHEPKKGCCSCSCIAAVVLVLLIVIAGAVAAVVLLLVRQHSTSPSPSASATPATVSGVVTTSTGIQISGIPVQGSAGIVYTDGSGSFTTTAVPSSTSGYLLVSINSCSSSVSCNRAYAPSTAAYAVVATGAAPTRYYKTVQLVSLTVSSQFTLSNPPAALSVSDPSGGTGTALVSVTPVTSAVAGITSSTQLLLRAGYVSAGPAAPGVMAPSASAGIDAQYGMLQSSGMIYTDVVMASTYAPVILPPGTITISFSGVTLGANSNAQQSTWWQHNANTGTWDLSTSPSGRRLQGNVNAIAAEGFINWDRAVRTSCVIVMLTDQSTGNACPGAEATMHSPQDGGSYTTGQAAADGSTCLTGAIGNSVTITVSGGSSSSLQMPSTFGTCSNPSTCTRLSVSALSAPSSKCAPTLAPTSTSTAMATPSRSPQAYPSSGNAALCELNSQQIVDQENTYIAEISACTSTACICSAYLSYIDWINSWISACEALYPSIAYSLQQLYSEEQQVRASVCAR